VRLHGTAVSLQAQLYPPARRVERCGLRGRGRSACLGTVLFTLCARLSAPMYKRGDITKYPMAMGLCASACCKALADRVCACHGAHTVHRDDAGTPCAAILHEALQRELPDHSPAFWACLRRAFPDAATDARQYEKCLANVALVYFAGSEATAGSIALALVALAADAETMAALEQARAPPILRASCLQ
jgi:hypothetical protein